MPTTLIKTRQHKKTCRQQLFPCSEYPPLVGMGGWIFRTIRRYVFIIKYPFSWENKRITKYQRCIQS
jgi:hypothetical protein